MSFSYDRYDRQQRTRRGITTTTTSSSRSTLGYWVPLIVTVTTATIGVATWIWSERRDHSEDDDYLREQRRRRRREDRQSPPATISTSYTTETHNDTTNTEYMNVGEAGNEWRAEDEAEAEGILAKMSGAIRRTPSPQKMFDYASRRVAAGVAAAGRGLSAITEEEGTRADFVDHERWSEEQKVQGAIRGADNSVLPASTAAPSRGRRKTVAVVVSAESSGRGLEDSHADIAQTSVLANITSLVDSSSTDLLILIYAPQLRSHPLTSPSNRRSRRPSSDGGSSYENIPTPGTEAGNALDGLAVSESGDDLQSSSYNAIASQALSLVEHPTSVLPFTTPSGHVHMLRHLSPNLVYLQESLCGHDGENVRDMSGWVGQVVVLLGAGGVGAAIVDTETEDEGPGHGVRKSRWWQDEARVGLGKGVDVVESVNFGEDWRKRAGN